MFYFLRTSGIKDKEHLAGDIFGEGGGGGFSQDCGYELRLTGSGSDNKSKSEVKNGLGSHLKIVINGLFVLVLTLV